VAKAQKRGCAVGDLPLGSDGIEGLRQAVADEVAELLGEHIDKPPKVKVIHTGGCPEERTLELRVEFADGPA
jgi:hypothetical protein